MIIYHGSTVLVEKPEIRISDSFLDFGTGFYTTTSEHQAERWARIKMRRESKNTGTGAGKDTSFRSCRYGMAAICCQKPPR